MIAPLIVQPVVLTTDAGPPDEPISPVMVVGGGVFVHVTAPPPPGAALRTAKFDAAPSEGADDRLLLERAASVGALMLDAELSLHPAVRSARDTRIPAATLGRTRVTARWEKQFLTSKLTSSIVKGAAYCFVS
jgi:hypothetical protein